MKADGEMADRVNYRSCEESAPRADLGHQDSSNHHLFRFIFIIVVIINITVFVIIKNIVFVVISISMIKVITCPGQYRPLL